MLKKKKILRRVLTSSIKLGRIRKLHVVVVHDGLDRNVPKSVKCDARAELLFCS